MKPFVKWAGGKTRLLKEIERRLPADFDEWENATYIEPFVRWRLCAFPYAR